MADLQASAGGLLGASFYNLSGTEVERQKKRRFTRVKRKLPSLSEQIDKDSWKKTSEEKLAILYIKIYSKSSIMKTV